MNTKKLSKSLTTALNAQMSKEAETAQVYFSYATWADNRGFRDIANFLFRHGQEERNHMMKILEYIIKKGAKVLVTVIPPLPENPVSLHNCFEKVFEHEVENTVAIYKLAKMCFDEEDWATWNFMQWFVKDQVVEEKLEMNLYEKLKIKHSEKITGNTLYSLDRVWEKYLMKQDQHRVTDNP